MGYKCLFLDNEVYTAQDVNDALSNIASGGVSGYPLGSGALADLNAAVNELANGGVNYHGTSCLLVNDGGTYKISEGACIMNDGTQIIFDYEGYAIEHEAGVKEYVYLERDVLHNTVNVVVSQTQGGQDTILLAEIEADGTIKDRRRFAKAKVALSADPQNIGIVKSISNVTLLGGNYIDLDFGFDGWKYLIFHQNLGPLSFLLEDGDAIDGIPVTKINNSLNYYLNASRNGSVVRIYLSGNSSITFNIQVEAR